MVIMLSRKFVVLALCVLCLIRSMTCFQSAPSRRMRQVALHSTPGLKKAVISENRQAEGDYEWDEKYHAGVMLVGSEVKSCRTKGSVNLKSGFIEIREGEAWLYQVHISEASRCGPIFQHEPKRTRKLLLHEREILKMEQRCVQRNMELIPTCVYWSDKNFVKVEIGVGKKKSVNDKRDDLIKKDGEKSIRRAMKGGFD